MGKMRDSWAFLPEHGFHGSAGKTPVKGYMRGGPVRKAVGGAVGPIRSEQKGPVKGSAPSAHLPSLSKKATTPHPYAHGGKVKGGPTDRKPAEGGILPYAEGGHHTKKGWKAEDQEEHESDTGFQHNDVEKPEQHYEAKKGGKIHHKAKGGPVSGRNGGGSTTPEHDHFLPEHRIVSKPPGVKHKHPGNYPDKHHSPPHKGHGHKEFAKGGEVRPMGMPRAPMIGMKRVRHTPGNKQMPGIPGMPPMGSSPLGLGAGSAPQMMKKGGKK